MNGIPATQEKAFSRLRALDPRMSLRWDSVRGVTASARGRLAEPGDPADPPSQALATFLEGYADCFGAPSSASLLTVVRQNVDGLGWTHLELQQRHSVRVGAAGEPQLLEVYAAKLAAHFDPRGALAAVESSCWPEIRVDGAPDIGADALPAILRKAAAQSPAFEELERRVGGSQPAFPMQLPPRLIVYPWEGRFRLAWTTYAYGSVSLELPSAEPGAGPDLRSGEVFVDASTGEVFLFSTMTAHVAGTGLGVTPVDPLGGPYVARNLSVTQVALSADHQLRDAGHAREIITYDLGCNSTTWVDGPSIAQGLLAGTAPISTNAGGANWNTALTNPPTTARVDSQQPEVDAHFFCGQAYEWYDVLGTQSRAGWDDNQFPGKVEANMPVRVVTHAPRYDGGSHTCQEAYSRFDVQPVSTAAGPLLVPFLVFCDGDPNLASGTASRSVDFLAGSQLLVGHEYQHCVTMFSFNHGGVPGIGYTGWAAAVHEGLSDVFGCLFSGSWILGPGISQVGLVIRNQTYPRDPIAWENLPGPYPQGLGHSNKDHFADCGSPPTTPGPNEAYDRGTILAHSAFLLGAGGVQQRLARSPALIPVRSIGVETIGGKVVSKAARIWYVGLKEYSVTLANDAEAFRVLRQACLNAAVELYGAGTVEHLTTELAFYAVGLHPSGATYGADVTFLRWGWDWRYSRPYLGGIYANAPDWASLDLFVNNGGGPSGWTAVIDPGGLPTPPENQVYCRVRNVGDQGAANVTVSFSYAKISTVAGPWQPVTDKNGNVQTLNVGTLAAGQMTFGDTQADQDAPPAAAMVRWWIPPLAPGEVVDHFCLKAVVTSTNDVNPHNNEVQSNIAYVRYSPAPKALRLWNEAVLHTPGPVETVVTTILPPRWRVTGPTPSEPPAGREAYASSLSIEMPADALDHIEAPFDGDIVAQITGSPSGSAHGALTMLTGEAQRLSGRAALTLAGAGMLLGTFKGSLDTHTAVVKGSVEGAFQSATTGRTVAVNVRLEGRLAPWRRVDVSQRAGGQTLGGLTVQIYGGAPGAEG